MGMYGALIVRPMDYNPKSPGTFTVYGRGTSTEFNKEFTFVLSEFDARWHRSIEGDLQYANYYAALWRPDLWFVNGRTFPNLILPFAWNKADGSAEYEPRYNTLVKVSPKDKFLIRYIHMGYQPYPMHQHGWHMRIVGKDAMKVVPQREEYTLHIGSGETWDTITVADPAYGVNAQSGSPLSKPSPLSPSKECPNGTLNWRIIYVIHSHNDYQVTTNQNYPGGGLIVIEACTDASKVPALPPDLLSTDPNYPFTHLYNECDIGRPSWENIYVSPICPLIPKSDLNPALNRADIEEVPGSTTGGCPGLPPKKIT
jgi:hypothetical protein